jgi:hypothetical protein
MPLTTYSTTYSSTIPKLELDYLNKVYKRQAVRYDRFAKDPAGCGSYLARIELSAPPQRFSKLNRLSTAQVVSSVGAG